MERISVFFAMMILIAMTYCSDSSSDKEKSSAQVEIGALIPLTGGFSDQGSTILKAVELAVADAKKEYSSRRLSVELIYDDTETDPDVAAVLAEKYIENGLKFIIGPITSSELFSIKELINSSNSIVISPSSTTPCLSEANDNIIRLIPDDSQMAKAMADQLWDMGVEKVVCIYREDEWGEALAGLVSEKFRQNGGTVLGECGYYGFRKSEYYDCFQEANHLIAEALSDTDPANIAIQITTLDEGVDLLETAYLDTSHLNIKKVRWMGSEGITLNESLLTNENAMKMTYETGFVSPMYEIEETESYQDIKRRIREETGKEPSVFSMIAYDAARVAISVLCENSDGETSDSLRAFLVSQLEVYEGVTGEIKLNEAGDRVDSIYGFYRVNSESSPFWEKITEK